ERKPAANRDEASGPPESGSEFTKAPFAFQSPIEPWTNPSDVGVFVPRWVRMFMTPPEARPNSGENWCVSTTNSSMTRSEKLAFGVVWLGVSLLSRPSTRYVFARPLWPLTTNGGDLSP